MIFRNLVLIVAVGVVATSHAQTPSLLSSDFNLDSKGVLLQITEDVPVFLKPDPRAPRMANAEAGTVLLVLEVSSKRSWVKVEDDEGTRGWIPVDRTDLPDLLKAQIQLRDSQRAETKALLEGPPPEADPFDESSASRYQDSARLTHVLGPVWQWNHGAAWGILYSALFDFQISERGGVRQRSLGAEAAWLRKSSANLYEFRLRFSSRYPSHVPLSYGPDVAVRFGDEKSPTTFFAGYRIGYDLFWRFPLEWRVGIGSKSGQRWLTEVAWRMRF